MNDRIHSLGESPQSKEDLEKQIEYLTRLNDESFYVLSKWHKVWEKAGRPGVLGTYISDGLDEYITALVEAKAELLHALETMVNTTLEGGQPVSQSILNVIDKHKEKVKQ